MSTLPEPRPAARPSGTPLVARTVEVDPDAPLLSLVPDLGDPRAVSSWVRRGEGLVGWGRALELTAHGADRFEWAQAWWRQVVDSAVVMAEAYLLDQKRLVPAAAYLEGEYGYKDLYLGVPVVIGAGGIEKILQVELPAEEKAMLKTSADSVQKVVDIVKAKV